ncbi:hypothetical protein ACN268_06290 [Micromonospora sp. WMMD735]|uniref:restriction system modified-DNA reader domain-containing protein n=1 Tax=Micromonospora sp. WMMD735 TaxID=3404130 RepID=UPI003B965848
MYELKDVLKQCVERIQRYRQQRTRIPEQSTRMSLIDPVIDALGWDIHDLEEVHPEYRRRGVDNPVDYALLILRTPRLFIEAKALGENLDDPRWANQIIGYAASAGVEWVALTNGAEWRVYNAHAPVPVEQKLFRVVSLESDLDAASELLSLLSKENMGQNRIEELWRGYFIDRQVLADLLDLFGDGEPAPELVGLLDDRLPRLTRNEIRSSLIRARASFDYPAPTMPVRSIGAANPATSLTAEGPVTMRTGSSKSSADGVIPPRRSKRAVSHTERSIKLADIIRVGRLSPGAELYARYKGVSYTAELLADGTVRFGGRPFPTPSAAGRALKIDANGPGTPETVLATDGLDFWSSKDAIRGDIASLKEIRRRTADREDG